MHTSSITSIGHKPLVHSLMSTDMASVFVLPIGRERLISLYVTVSQAHVMLRGRGTHLDWEGTWAPIPKEEAIEVAREEAFRDGLRQDQNLFYVMDESAPNLLRSMHADGDTASARLDCSALEGYIDEDCLVVFYGRMRKEVQMYRVREHAIEWWYKFRPHTLDDAIRMATDCLDDYELTMDQLFFHEVSYISV